MQTNDSYLKKLHADILTIMDEIDRVCRENNLKYYLIGGTLLGAIRHKGFIPWDDDLDIVMPREDLNKFIEISDQVLKPDFEFMWHTTRPKYNHFFPKLCLRNTLFYQDFYKSSAQTGIFVDIFPLDYSSNYQASMEGEKKIIRRLDSMLGCWSIKKFSIRNVVFNLLGVLFKKKITNIISKRIERLGENGGSHYINLGSGYSMKRQTMPVEWFGDGCLVPFENKMFVAPTEYTKVLTSIFGSSFMELPPVEKRFSHYPLKVIFKDGSSMEFNQTKGNEIEKKD